MQASSFPVVVSLATRCCGCHPVLLPTLPLLSRQERNLCCRKGFLPPLPFQHASHSSVGTSWMLFTRLSCTCASCASRVALQIPLLFHLAGLQVFFFPGPADTSGDASIPPRQCALHLTATWTHSLHSLVPLFPTVPFYSPLQAFYAPLLFPFSPSTALPFSPCPLLLSLGSTPCASVHPLGSSLLVPISPLLMSLLFTHLAFGTGSCEPGEGCGFERRKGSGNPGSTTSVTVSMGENNKRL